MPRCLLLLILAASSPIAAAAEEPLQAGFGETDITPRLQGHTVYMAGFGHNRQAAGVHDRLHARAVVLKHKSDKIALVSVDLVGLFHPHVERVRKQLPGFRYILVSSTHTHEGPDTLGLWGPNPFQSGVDAEYLALVEKQIVAAVRAADAARGAVTARIGSARAPELLRDSREPQVKHDELVALEFRDKDDKATGIIVQWNCHPETLGDKNKQISGDFVSAAVKALQAKHHCPIVYLTGTVGGLMTSLGVEVESAAGKSLADATFEKTERYGELLAGVAARALKTARPVQLTPFRIRSRTLFLPLDNKLFRLALQVGVLKRQAFVWSGDPYKAEPAKNSKDDRPLCTRTEIARLRLGELDIAAIPGEIYPELVLGKVQQPADAGADYPNAPVEPAIYAQMRGPHRMLIGLANDEIGYIIPKRQWDEKPPYCYGRKKAQYGEINSLGPNTAPLLCRAFRELTEISDASQKRAKNASAKQANH